MRVVETITELRTLRNAWPTDNVAFVPTMGALHAGHASLIEMARQIGSKVIVSIFVNPLQFGPKEDFKRYPRPRENDLSLCQELGVDLVFYPKEDELYPNGMEILTVIEPPPSLTLQLCGASRPGHFTGVATVVLKLLNIVQPDFAVFGKKDAQQLAVIQRMVNDLNLPVTILPAPTVRESDGLAMSSRNKYLVSASDRQQARLLHRLLQNVRQLYQQGMETTQEAFALAQEQTLDESLYPDFQLEYLAAVHPETFQPVELLEPDTLILVAAKVGQTRLIDNLALNEAPSATSSGDLHHLLQSG